MNVGAGGLVVLLVGVTLAVCLAYWVVRLAVAAGVRSGAMTATDEVISRLVDYGWQPPEGLTAEAQHIRDMRERAVIRGPEDVTPT